MDSNDYKEFYDEDSSDTFDESSMSDSSTEVELTNQDIEKEIHDSVDDWKKTADLSVTVTGRKGVGKSYLVNTLLEATSLDCYESEQDIYNSEHACEPEKMDEKQLRQNLRAPESSLIKPYKHMTSYAFESGRDVQKSMNLETPKESVKGFSIKQYLESGESPGKKSKLIRSTYKKMTFYSFNEDQTSKEYEFDVGPFDKNFVLDESFLQSMNWPNYKNASNEYKSWYENNKVYIDDSTAFLLPQGQSFAVPQCISVRYGKIPELIVSFPQESELRLVLWELHDIYNGVKNFPSEEHMFILNARYRCMLGLNETDTIPLPRISSPQDLPLTRQVRMLVGNNFRFVGLGKSLEQDRIYVREKLKDAIKNYGYYMCRLLLRVPSSLLEGNREIVDVSGPYLRSDFQTKRAIENTNLMIIVMDRLRGLSLETADMLEHTGLSNKMLSNPELYKTVFVELSEQFGLEKPEDLFLPSRSRQLELVQQQLMLQWRKILALSSRYDLSTSCIEPALMKTSFISAHPTLYKSMILRQDFPTELLNNLNHRSVLSATSIPFLLSIIPNHVVLKLGLTLHKFSQVMIMKKSLATSEKQTQNEEIRSLWRWHRHFCTEDSSSQFRVLGHQFYGSEHVHLLVRMQIISEILSNPNIYAQFLRSKTQGQMDIQEYAYVMSNTEIRGDYVTLLAFANMTGCNILVYSENSQFPLSVTPTKHGSNCLTNRKQLHILIVSESYYVSLIEDTRVVNFESIKWKNQTKKRKRPIENVDTDAVTEVQHKTKKQKPKTLYNNVFPSLVDICITEIADNIDCCPPLNFLPVEILIKLIHELSRMKKLSDSSLDLLISEDMTSLCLEGPGPNISDASLLLVARKCKLLKRLSLVKLSGISYRGLSQLLKSCPLLEEIDLSGCTEIETPSVQEIARNCPKLKIINLTNCRKVSDIGLQEIALACPDIHTIIVRGCHQLTDSAFQFIGKKMKVFDLLECVKITDKSIVNIAKHSRGNLKELKLPGKGITNLGLDAIYTYCKELTTLSLDNADAIQDEVVSRFLNSCQKITNLSLASCRNITDEAFVNLEKPLNLLKTLNLSHCLNIHDESIDAITTHCPGLKNVNLSYADISNEALAYLSKRCRQLKSLDITICRKITDEGISALSSLNYLKYLNVSNIPSMTMKSVELISNNMKELKSLNFSMTNINDEALEKLTKGCPNLEALDLNDTLVTATGIKHLAHCKMLSKLSLSCSLDDQALHTLYQNCPHISDLSLLNCRFLSTDALKAALGDWISLKKLNLRAYHPSAGKTPFTIESKYLEELNLSWCKLVDDMFLSDLVDSCPNLLHLDISWCTEVTSNGIYKFLRNSTELRTLNIRGCSKIGYVNCKAIVNNELMLHR